MNQRKTVTLVIARYKEDIDWIYSITNPDINIVIIDKSGKKPLKIKPLVNNNNVKIIYLPNIGRETYSFLYYIVTFYKKLDDFTIFSQGHPFDHYQNMLVFINQKQYNKFQALTDKSINVVENQLPTELLFRSLIDYPPNQNPEIDGPKFKYVGFRFPVGAQFCVPKNYLLNRPRPFWKSLLKNLKWKTNDMLPYYFERIFLMLYDPYYKINPTYLKKLK